MIDFNFNATGTGGPLDNLPDIQKSTMKVTRKCPLKAGDRVTIVLGRNKIYEHIVTEITHWDPRDPWNISYTSRPATPEDGPSNKKLIRKMRMSQRKRAIRRFLRMKEPS